MYSYSELNEVVLSLNFVTGGGGTHRFGMGIGGGGRNCGLGTWGP